MRLILSPMPLNIPPNERTRWRLSLNTKGSLQGNQPRHLDIEFHVYRSLLSLEQKYPYLSKTLPESLAKASIQPQISTVKNLANKEND